MDTAKPESQQQPLSETETTSESISSPPLPPKEQPDISPGVYPAPLQTYVSSETRSRSRSGSSPPRKAEAETLAADSFAGASSRHERMPSVNSLPPREGQFGVISSTGQLVCDFRPNLGAANADETPKPPPASEANITSASFATNSEQRAPGVSVSPPPATASSTNSPPVVHPTVSTLELAVDYNSYPEVYIPEAEQQQVEQTPSLPPRRTTTGSPPIPRKSLPPMDYNSSITSGSPPPPAPAYSTPADYQRIGYTGTLDMSTAVATVTPLHMLGDQPDTVDCPFCMRRVETAVKKRASGKTHMWGTILFFGTLFGVAAPYCCHWYTNIEHHCKNCRRKVAQRKYNSTEMEALGTRPEHRQMSYYPPPEEVEKKKKKKEKKSRS